VQMRAGILYLGSVYVSYFFLPRRRQIMEEAPEFHRLFFETVSGIFLYDFFFFFIHLWYHVTRCSWHMRHHTDCMVTATTTVDHSFIDAFFQVAVNIILQQRSIFGGPKHDLSRILHNIIVTYLLTEIHSGYDGFWCTHRIWPWLFGGSKRHHEHHRTGIRYFQQFFCYIDDTMAYFHFNPLKSNTIKSHAPSKSVVLVVVTCATLFPLIPN